MRGLKINTPFYTISFYSHFIFGKNKSKERICINILDGLSCVDKRLFSFSKYPFRVDESVAGKKTRKYTERKDFFITAGWDSSLPWVLNNEKDFLPRFRLPRQQHLIRQETSRWQRRLQTQNPKFIEWNLHIKLNPIVCLAFNHLFIYKYVHAVFRPPFVYPIAGAALAEETPSARVIYKPNICIYLPFLWNHLSECEEGAKRIIYLLISNALKTTCK